MGTPKAQTHRCHVPPEPIPPGTNLYRLLIRLAEAVAKRLSCTTSLPPHASKGVAGAADTTSRHKDDVDHPPD
jgi:hypothetical protein